MQMNLHKKYDKKLKPVKLRCSGLLEGYLHREKDKGTKLEIGEVNRQKITLPKGYVTWH